MSRREASSPVTPKPLLTASRKKLALSKLHQSSAEHSVSSRDSADGACSSDSSSEMKGLRLIDIGSLLASVNRRASCNFYSFPLSVKENLKFRKGLCTEISLSCTNPLCAGSDNSFSDRCKHSKALNARFVLVGRMCGMGLAGLETFCGVMGLPPPVTSKSYSEHNSRIHTISNEMCLESYRSASVQLHRLQGAEPTGVVDVTVTCEGTWSKRGGMF